VEIAMDTKLGQPVVVGVDGSDSALRAVHWAADEAARQRVPLRLVAAFGWTDNVTVGFPRLDTRYRDILFDASHEALEKAVEAARKRQPELELVHEVRVGHPIGVLAEEARRAQLLVVGDRGLNRVEGLLVGSVGVAMAAHAACPVVVVRGAELIDPTRPIVVGVDGSPVGEAAIAFAFQAAADRSAPLTAVHTWWDTALDQSPAVLFRDEEQAFAQEQLAQRLAGWGEKYPHVEVTRLVARDRAVHLLLERSRTAQLVVVGSRGHGELAGLVLGSVSNALVHKAGCPVAIVRPPSTER
jgi:nucleotide-binding universal stress UspA family protein